jgi:DNA-binding transcriptional LysR family regulator
MALEGHGIAFLPMSAVQKEVRAKKLVSAAPPELKDLHITMDVRVYRERPSNRDAGKLASFGLGRSGGAPKSNAQALWDYLVSQSGANKTS